MRTLQKTTPARSWYVSGIFGLVLTCWTTTPASSSELSFALKPGFDQQRNFERSGFVARQLVRSLPPTNEPYTFTIQVPATWLSSGSPVAAGAGLEGLNQKHLSLLATAMSDQGLIDSKDPLLLAGRAIALLRPMEVGGARAPARYQQIWPLWEVLVHSPSTDTLSVAVSAVQFLKGLGVSARVAKYPADSGIFCFGVLVTPLLPPSAEPRPWAQKVGSSFLFPVAFSTKPVAGLEPEQVPTWEIEQVLKPGWISSLDPGGGQTSDPKIHPLEFPDPRKQAEALGLVYVEESSQDHLRHLTYLLILSIAGLCVWLGSLIQRHRMRKRKAAALRMERKENRF